MNKPVFLKKGTKFTLNVKRLDEFELNLFRDYIGVEGTVVESVPCRVFDGSKISHYRYRVEFNGEYKFSNVHHPETLTSYYDLYLSYLKLQ